MKFFFLWFAQCTHSFLQIKGTVSVISSNHPCKDDNVRFTTVPLKSSDQVWNRYPRFFQTGFFPICDFSAKVTIVHFLLIGKKKKFSELFESEYNVIVHISDQIKVSRVTLLIGLCHWTFAWRVTWNYVWSPFNM